MRVTLTISFEVDDDEVATPQARYDLRQSVRKDINRLQDLHMSKLRKVIPKYEGWDDE